VNGYKDFSKYATLFGGQFNYFAERSYYLKVIKPLEKTKPLALEQGNRRAFATGLKFAVTDKIFLNLQRALGKQGFVQ